MKKLLAVLCTLAMLISMFGMTAMADGEVTYTQVTSVEDLKAGGEFVVVAKYVNGETTTYFTIDCFTEHTTKIESLIVNVENGVLTYDGEMPLWTVAACEDGISLSDNKGGEGTGDGYVGWDGNENKKNTSVETNPYKWDITANDDGTFTLTTNSGDRYFGFRDNSKPDEVVHRWGVFPTADLNEKHVVKLMFFAASAAPAPGPGIDDTADINTAPLYAVLVLGLAVVAFASKKRFAK